MSSPAATSANPSAEIADPRQGGTFLSVGWAAGALNDPRDTVFVGLMFLCAPLVVLGASLFFVDRAFWYLAAIYWLYSGVLVLDRFILMLHCTSHRPLFRPRFRRLNLLIPWLLGPFLGVTPESYFVHHLGMHHREGNSLRDASSTMKYRRDRFDHWLRYVSRFELVGFVDVVRYLRRLRSRHLMIRFVKGEAAFCLTAILLATVSVRATLVVFVIPFFVARLLMMTGNWAQHAFVCPIDPGNPYRNSITCINTRYNRRCFNDGYHINHHVAARRHWTEYPAEFEANLGRYGAEDAIVFRGVDYFGVWVCLMLHRWETLARAFVHLPNAPVRNDSEVIALLQRRLAPFNS
jgi:fatty acid desaturase